MFQKLELTFSDKFLLAKVEQTTCKNIHSRFLFNNTTYFSEFFLNHFLNLGILHYHISKLRPIAYDLLVILKKQKHLVSNVRNIIIDQYNHNQIFFIHVANDSLYIDFSYFFLSEFRRVSKSRKKYQVSNSRNLQLSCWFPRNPKIPTFLSRNPSLTVTYLRMYLVVTKFDAESVSKFVYWYPPIWLTNSTLVHRISVEQMTIRVRSS